MMFRNYLKIALRSLLKQKLYSGINIFGLALGMACSLLIGLWVYDELSFNTSFANYGQIAQVMQNNTLNGEVKTWSALPVPLANELRTKYGSTFQYVIMTSGTNSRILRYADQKLTKKGSFVEPDAPKMLTLPMLKGTRDGLRETASILLAESAAKALFGDENPLNKLLTIDNISTVKVTGVYADFPANSSFRDVLFMAPWNLYLADNEWIKTMSSPWQANIFPVFVQLAPHTTVGQVSNQIKWAKYRNVDSSGKTNKPALFLAPMSDWHLYSVYKNGINAGGPIDLVRLFGAIGVFVLLLACINFMNLSTARSEKRAKEIGIRKVVGSVRSQLIAQFLGESLLIVGLAFALALLLVGILLPYVNEVLDKQMTITWSHPVFWLSGIGFSVLTGLLAGSYPAFYLSAFQPINALKGTFRTSRIAVLSRRMLVVFQFTVSISLIIGSVMVFRQIEFAKNRPTGYTRAGLIMQKLILPDLHNQFDGLQDELKKSGAIVEMAESSAPPTGIFATDGGFDWPGKDPTLSVDFPHTGVSYDFGETVGWTFKQGRDFSRAFATDSSGFVLNEAAVKFMGLQHPVGQIIRWRQKPFHVIGVIKNMVVESPYQSVRPSIYSIAKRYDNYLILRLNPVLSLAEALRRIETVFRQYSPATPFDYQFVDEEYARKFQDEERIGKLASTFSLLAVIISCLGIFGLASFSAETRTKEISIRKVLGANAFSVWSLLSKDFIWLVLIAFGIATPIVYYLLLNWLQKYEYRTGLPWWIFAVSGIGVLSITLLTVSYQSIRAALMNPVKSLRSE